MLLVEDDEGDAFLVRELLADVAPELDVVTARSLAEAEAAIAHADCVLLDLGLPDTTGLDGLVRLRRRAPDTAVIVLTGHGDAHLGMEAVAAGAQDYLIKGRVDGEMLARAIRYAIVRRRAERSERALLEAELHSRENARLERGLLPTALLRDERTSLTAGYRPGRRRAVLGGDFYDAVELEDGTLHLMIGDVCGHGPDEAALGVALRIAWRTLTLARRPAPEVFDTLEQVIVAERHRSDIFTTLAALAVAPDRRSADVWLAGHPAPIMLAPGSPTELPVGRVHLPVGLGLGRPLVTTTVALPAAWSLMLYTDGLIEGRTGAGTRERLGTRGLTAVLDRLVAQRPGWPAEPAALLDTLVDQVEKLNGGPHADDVAALIVSSGEP
ncbi:MAG: fused response regulator/phosphatase [Solirubrobacterales bacterium]